LYHLHDPIGTVQHLSRWIHLLNSLGVAQEAVNSILARANPGYFASQCVGFVLLFKNGLHSKIDIVSVKSNEVNDQVDQAFHGRNSCVVRVVKTTTVPWSYVTLTLLSEIESNSTKVVIVERFVVAA
jgi:hypothetical protein